MYKVEIKKAEYRPKNNNNEEGTKFVRNSVSEIEETLYSKNKLKNSLLLENKEFQFNLKMNYSNNKLNKSLLSENKEFEFNFLLKKKTS